MPGTFTISGQVSPEAWSAAHPTSESTGVTSATTGAIASGLTAYSQLPGYSTSIANIGKAVESETAGQVPDDVISTLKQKGAEGNVQTGAASNAAYLHALGLTSLGLQTTGASTLNSTVQNLPGAAISQNSQYYQTQQQSQDYALQQQLWQQQLQQQQQAYQEQEKALAAAKSAVGGNGDGKTTYKTYGGLYGSSGSVFY